MRTLSRVAVCVLAMLAGCAKDKCVGEPASFELSVSLQNASLAARARTLRVAVLVNDSGWKKEIPLGSSFGDGSTALAIVIDPPPSGAYQLTVEATAVDEQGAALASAQRTVQATADGCNRVVLDLSASDLPDAGAGDAMPLDAAPDSGSDAGIVDPDAADPDAGVDTGVQDTGEVPDTGVAPDTGEVPDTGVAPDTGVTPDAGPAPDAAGTAFPYTPANFDPNALTPLVGLTIDCGTVTFDSTTLSFMNFCGGTQPIAVATTTRFGARPIAIIPASRLEIGGGSTLRLIGDKPVVLAIYGNAQIEGLVDASASGTSPGAGASTNPDCATGTGQSAPTPGHGGGGGGAYVSAAGAGGRGSDFSAGGLAGTQGAASTEPLRCGCGGGNGVTGSANAGLGGAGGGGVQISAAGDLDLVGAGGVAAGGGGGAGGTSRGGGGGGGSGGMILIESVNTHISGLLIANGGGGGGASESNLSGGPGQDGVRANPAGGSSAIPSHGGNGGRGASRTQSVRSGTNNDENGGGGGGGASTGAIFARGISSCTATGSISPSVVGCP
ncbi:MAG: hypothetical protein U1E65_35805 [Myxococcota bacterium]